MKNSVEQVDTVGAMEAGRELDALVHERVMGNPPVGCTHERVTRVNPTFSNLLVCDDCGEDFGDTTYAMARSWYPFYSTDITAAWEAVAHIGNADVKVRPGYVYATVLTRDGREGRAVADGDPTVAAPLAICRAALLATDATLTPDATTPDTPSVQEPATDD